MKIVLEPTTKIVEINGIPARIWEGCTSDGVIVHAYITRVAVRASEPPEVHAKFAAELKECRAPSAAVKGIPARLVL